MITKEVKQKVIEKYGGNAKNTGSTEAQVALLTERIKDLSSHVSSHRKDFVTLRSLRTMVSQRKKLLKYMKKKDIEKYRKLLKDLSIRGQ